MSRWWKVHFFIIDSLFSLLWILSLNWNHHLGHSGVTVGAVMKNDVHIQIKHQITFPTVYYMTLFDNFHFWRKFHGPKSAIMDLGPSDVTEWPEMKNDVHIQILHRITIPAVYYMTLFDNFHFSRKFHIASSGPKSAIMDLGRNPGVPVVRFFGSTIKVDLHPIESVCANFHILFTIWTICLNIRS